MSSYPNQQYYPSSGGGPPLSPVDKKNSYKKGLGFVPNTMGRFIREPITDLLKNAPKIARGQFTTSEKDTFSSELDATIPLFNLEHISQASGDEKVRLVQAFGIGLSQVGFVAIKADNLTHLIDRAHNEMNHYFHQPLDKKVLDWRSNSMQYGFSHIGREIAPNTKYADIKESFFIPPNFSEWPNIPSSFAQTIKEYHAVITGYAKQLTKYIMEYLGQTREDVEGNMGFSKNILRLAYYPSIKPGDESRAFWAAPHVDKNVISITSPGTIPGLQLLTNQGQWKPVLVPKGFLIVNTGMMLQHKTAGLIKARPHRVINPGAQYTRMERFSTVFFATWQDDYSLNPFENCMELATRGMTAKRKRAYLKKYTNMTVARYTQANSN